jgi:hypothetical protein
LIIFFFQSGTDLDKLDGCQDGNKKNKVVVGICAMEKKSLSKPMKEILSRMEEFEYISMTIFTEETIANVIIILKCILFDLVLYFFVCKLGTRGKVATL